MTGDFMNRPYYVVNSKSLCFWKPLTPGEVARKARRRGLYLYKFCPLSQLTLTAPPKGGASKNIDIIISIFAQLASILSE